MATENGIVAFEVAGVAHKLQFTTNRLCLLEDKLAKTPLDIAVELELNPHINTIRAMMWAGLGNGDVAMAAIGDMIDVFGRPEAIDLVREAFAAAFPDRVKDKAGGSGNPPSGAAG